MAHEALNTFSVSSSEHHNDNAFNEDDEAAIRERRLQKSQGTVIRSVCPKALGWFSVFCVISNRMIGSGIFRTPDTVIKETESISAAMLIWALGAVVAFAGVLVFVEFGNATPRIYADGHVQSVPANGGEKNYLEHVYTLPRRLATTLFGTTFIFWGNMASNALLFGYSFHVAVAGREASNGVIRAIAIAVATLACLLHIYSRQLGILLNNGFGILKVLMLLGLLIIGIISFAGELSTRTISGAKDNFVNHVGFVDPPSGSYGYASSFLAILFAYGGFNQANYILGNIKQPRRKFKWEVISAVGTICMLYICLNICYYGIAPYEQLISPNYSTTILFFGRTISKSHASRAAAAFQSFSSLGNIIIQTFTAARVKQEVAKEGILPWSIFFAQNRKFTWRFWRHKAKRNADGEATPVGALLLHWVFCIALILGSWSLTPLNAYRLYVNLYSFTIDALFGFAVGAGLLFLRISDFFRSKNRWSDISNENKWVSISAASVFTVANLYPIVAIWFRPPKGQPQAGKSTIPYWVTGTVGFATLGCGLVYWIGLEYIYPWIADEELSVKKQYFTHEEHGETVVTNEIVSIAWEDK